MEDCLFCKIIQGEIPSNTLYEDEKILAFYDISPEAPIHFLVVPKKHIVSLDKMAPEDTQLITHLIQQIPLLAKTAGIENGYRVVTNVGENGGQTVSHLHFHVLGGRNLSWPPG